MHSVTGVLEVRPAPMDWSRETLFIGILSMCCLLDMYTLDCGLLVVLCNCLIGTVKLHSLGIFNQHLHSENGKQRMSIYH